LPDWALSFNDTLFRFVTRGEAYDQLRVFAPLGLIAGVILSQWSARLIARESHGTRRLKLPGRLAIIVSTALLYPALVFAVIHLRCQWLTEGGSIDWAQWRMPYYFVLIGLLVVATTIDFDQYLIPDEITTTGMVIGVAWATLFGHMHLIPMWIDWNDVHPYAGPYIPEWIKQHAHLHGFLWSIAGLVTGAGVTWLARFVSHTVLGVEALGFGDVTLMGMIGSFLGWQPVVLVFLIAPICGLVIGLTMKLIHARRAVPYGPYLGVAAVFVLFTWAWLWVPTRELFGLGPTLVGLGGLMFILLAAMLGLIRLYRSIPVTRRVVRPSTEVVATEIPEATGDPEMTEMETDAATPALSDEGETSATEFTTAEGSPDQSAERGPLRLDELPENATHTNTDESAPLPE
jgi:leader peptidase (prepilin peptidase) / N-methyltransferase